MEILNFLLISITLTYTLFIGLLIYGFLKVKTFETSNIEAQTTFSIVVPFRNEEQNLAELLQSFSTLNYPKHLFKIILVDDDSEDLSVAIINEWKTENPLFDLSVLKNIRTSNSPKKDAITQAISISKSDWIITTDADCEVNPGWLLTFDQYIQKNQAEMMVGAVSYFRKSGLLSHFQQMDLLSLQGATIGSFGLNKAFMCNGANFGYTKKLFQELDGFNGNNHISSGDDVFLLQKAIAKYPEKVHYLKSQTAIVTTKTEETWAKLFFQRVRWASKATAYQSDFSKGLAVVVFLMNLGLVCFLGIGNWKLLLALFLIKFIVDFILMYKTNHFLRMCMYSAIISSIIYSFFSSVVALYSLVGNYEWKGRNFKK
jgi:cellulose synthase/poly-beta-1,6-N-acetylglucosamine synthase-like glycosyltransferase